MENKNHENSRGDVPIFFSGDDEILDEIWSQIEKEESFNKKKPGRTLEVQSENFDRNPCGDSTGGFEPNNTCSKGGSSDKPVAVSTYVHKPRGLSPVGAREEKAANYREAAESRRESPSVSRQAPTVRQETAPKNPTASETSPSAPEKSSEKELDPRVKQSIDRLAKLAKDAKFTYVRNGKEVMDRLYGAENVTGAVAAFVPEYGTILFNEQNAYYKDPEGVMQKMNDIGHLSTAHVDHPVVHEIGHGYHFRAVGKERFKELRKVGLPPHIAAKVKYEVSRYAATNPLETVAEMFTGMFLGGKTYSNELMEYYKSIGGPMKK